MTAEADVATPVARFWGASDRLSWIDWLVGWLESRPGPTWLVYVILGTIGILVANAIWWLQGNPVEPNVYWSVFGLFPVVELALIRHMDRVAADALTTFRPLLDRSEANYLELKRRLTTLPWQRTAIFTAAWILLGFSGDIVDPAAHRLTGISAPLVGLILVVEGVINGLLGAFVLKALRHLLDVARIHREAPRIDLLAPAPLYAFSKLTSQTALGLLFLLAVLVPSLAPTYFSAAAASDTTRVSFVSMVIFLAATATGMFVLPLYGMHRRIVDEKVRLEAASGGRLTTLLAELDHDVHERDLARADGLNKLIASVLAEREMLARLPTWPWQAATLRAFVSALLLPVLVYVLARAAEQVVL